MWHWSLGELVNLNQCERITYRQLTSGAYAVYAINGDSRYSLSEFPTAEQARQHLETLRGRLNGQAKKG